MEMTVEEFIVWCKEHGMTNNTKVKVNEVQNFWKHMEKSFLISIPVRFSDK